MSALLRALWWSAAGLIGWTYVGFPLVLLARARLRPRPVAAAPIEPSVTMVVAAHDEARVIAAKLENALDLDYPADRFEVVVASDGSTDGTNAIVAGFADRGVRLIQLPRVGKAAALDAGIGAARGEVIVFSDANSLYDRGAIRALVAPFADPQVGGVAGDQRYRTSARGEGAGERQYWDLDRRLKEAESRAGSVISATGAIYAVRRSLLGPTPVGVTDDFAISTGVVAQDRRLVFAPDAVAWEEVAPAGASEYARKVRIMTRGLRGVALRAALLDPRRSGFYAVQLATHKLLRRLMVVPLATLALASPLLWGRGGLYRAATLAQVGFYGLAALGTLGGERPVARSKAVSFPAFFLQANVAAAQAAWNVVRGRRIDRWEPTERTAAADGEPGGGR